MPSLCVLPVYQGVSGPASFRTRLTTNLESQGIHVHTDPLAKDCGGVLVIGGTRHLGKLFQAKRNGLRIVQRLDGMNWIHRSRWTGVRHFMRAEINNMLLAYIRRFLTDEIIYQSQYVIGRWNSVYGEVKAKSHLIYNGVDLNVFSPLEEDQPPQDLLRIACVEGRWGGGHEVSLRNAILLGEAIQAEMKRPVELIIAGKVDPNAQTQWGVSKQIHVTWAGILPVEGIVNLNRSAQIFFSAEINAPCPNSVIEALACGCPVISFNTGSLPELVGGDAGRLVPYGTRPDRLGIPDVKALANAAVDVIQEQDRFRRSARERAEKLFDLSRVVQKYLEVCLP